MVESLPDKNSAEKAAATAVYVAEKLNDRNVNGVRYYWKLEMMHIYFFPWWTICANKVTCWFCL